MKKFFINLLLFLHTFANATGLSDLKFGQYQIADKIGRAHV